MLESAPMAKKPRKPRKPRKLPQELLPPRSPELDELAAWHQEGAKAMLGGILDAIMERKMVPMPSTSSRRH